MTRVGLGNYISSECPDGGDGSLFGSLGLKIDSHLTDGKSGGRIWRFDRVAVRFHILLRSIKDHLLPLTKISTEIADPNISLSLVLTMKCVYGIR